MKWHLKFVTKNSNSLSKYLTIETLRFLIQNSKKKTQNFPVFQWWQLFSIQLSKNQSCYKKPLDLTVRLVYLAFLDHDRLTFDDSLKYFWHFTQKNYVRRSVPLITKNQTNSLSHLASVFSTYLKNSLSYHSFHDLTINFLIWFFCRKLTYFCFFPLQTVLFTKSRA